MGGAIQVSFEVRVERPFDTCMYVFLRFDDHYEAARAICGMDEEKLDGNVLKVDSRFYR